MELYRNSSTGTVLLEITVRVPDTVRGTTPFQTNSPKYNRTGLIQTLSAITKIKKKVVYFVQFNIYLKYENI